MPGISTPSSPSPTLLSFYFSLNILIFFPPPFFCQLHNTAPSCLHIAWSETTNWSFTACSRCVLPFPDFLISLVCLLSCVFSPFTCGPHDLSLSTRKKTQDSEEWNGTLKMVLLASNNIATVTKCDIGLLFGMLAGLFLRVAISERCCLEHCVFGGGIF